MEIDPNSPIQIAEHVADPATPGEVTEPVSPERLTAHPFAKEYRGLPANDRAQMAADIKKNGLKQRITLYQGKVLDGRNRLKACLEHGIPLKPTDFIEFIGDDKAAQAFVHSSNLFRRHLTPAEKQEKIAQALQAAPEESDREIARVVGGGVHHETVGAARADLERRGVIRHVDRRKDSVGRSYSARRQSEAETSPARPAIDLAAKRKASAVIAFSQLLHEGEINLHLNTLLKILGDEKERIAALPKAQRESFVRGVLAVVEITLDDLRPIASTPMFH
jgi:ParB-like chromosome segregation protein Spo0J